MTAMPRRYYLWFLSALLAASSNFPLAAAAEPDSAGSQGTAPPSDAMNEGDTQNSGNDLTRPVNSFEVRLRYQPSSSPVSTTEKEYALLRATTRIGLDQGWKVSLYGQTEGVDQQTSSTKSGSAAEAGLADTVVQTVLIREVDDRWAFGAGARVDAPTGEDNLGTRKWQVMPDFGVSYAFLELGPDNFFVPAMRYAISIAGTHMTRDISELQLV
jgi:Putative MetA-pathway of phenol degradation